MLDQTVPFPADNIGMTEQIMVRSRYDEKVEIPVCTNERIYKTHRRIRGTQRIRRHGLALTESQAAVRSVKAPTLPGEFE